MNKFIITLLCFAYIICANNYLDLDFANTEPYYDFNWIDEDKYTITMNFISTATVANEKCCLYNGTVLCSSSCKGSGKQLTCEFTGNECKADSDNPSTKYYHALLCGVCESSNTEAQLSTAYNEDFTSNSLTETLNPQITIVVSGNNYIKYSMFLLLSLLVL